MKIQIPESVLIRELDGESVLLNMETEQYFALNESATVFWHGLKDTGTTEGALAVASATFEADDETLSEDIAAFVDNLSNRGLIELVATD